MAMIPINEAKQRLQDLIDAVSQSHQPIVITSQNSNAILLSEADWLAIQETLYLLSIPGMRESIRAGLATPIEECETLEDSLTLRYRELEW
jgi:prevent-host-death family protein